jgi:UDP-glucose 4-epimerase
MSIYLITGIAGFIGSSIARELVRRGKMVRGIDNFSTGKPENLASISRAIDFRKVDLLDMRGVIEACEGVDYVIHQAAIPSVPRSIADPISCNGSNVDGTLNLLVAARDAGARRVVYASSSSLYGDTPHLLKTEDLAPNPISPYAVSKLAGEYYMRSFHAVYGVETVSLRYFNVFGPYQDPGSMYTGVMAIFIPKMLRQERPTIYGDGQQSRDFTYIDNIVDANLLACHAPADQVAGRYFNIAGGRRVTVNEIYGILQRLLGYAEAAFYAPERPGDIKHSLADIRLAKEHLGYRPSVEFEEGLNRTVEWYRSQTLLPVPV